MPVPSFLLGEGSPLLPHAQDLSKGTTRIQRTQNLRGEPGVAPRSGHRELWDQKGWDGFVPSLLPGRSCPLLWVKLHFVQEVLSLEELPAGPWSLPWSCVGSVCAIPCTEPDTRPRRDKDSRDKDTDVPVLCSSSLAPGTGV